MALNKIYLLNTETGKTPGSICKTSAASDIKT